MKGLSTQRAQRIEESNLAQGGFPEREVEGGAQHGIVSQVLQVSF
jgi:hypothetical protein